MCVAIVIPESYKQALGLGHTKPARLLTIPAAMNHKMIVTGKAII